MSIKKVLAVTLAPYLPVFGAIFGVILFGVSTYFGNATMFFLSIIIISVLPPVLKEIGNSIKERYEATQNEVDIIAMIPEWVLGLEMLAGIAIVVMSIALKSFAIFYLGAWLLSLGISLGMAKEINGLKEDLRSPDLEKRHAAMEEVESDKQIATLSSLFLILVNVIILITTLPNAIPHSTIFTLAKVVITIVLLPISLLPCYIVYEQIDKLMSPEPGKVASAAS